MCICFFCVRKLKIFIRLSICKSDGFKKELLVYLRFIINQRILSEFGPNQRQVYPMKTKEKNES